MEEASNKEAKNATANAAQAGSNTGKGKDGKTGKTCHRCKRVGHLKADCFATTSNSGEELPPNGVTRPPQKLKSNANAQKANEASEPDNSNTDGNVWMAVAMEALASLELPPGSWIVDSGASHHMSPDRSLFATIQDYSTDVCLANGRSIKATGIGRVEVCVQGKTLNLTDVLFVLELDGNLLSIGAASKHGITVEFGLVNVVFKHNGAVVATANQHGLVYIVELTNRKAALKVLASGKSAKSLATPATAGGTPPMLGQLPESTGAVPEAVGASLKTPAAEGGITPESLENLNSLAQAQTDYAKWHWRFGHAGAYCLKRLKSSVEGITNKLHPNKGEKDCSACLHSKMIRVQNKGSTPRATRSLERVFSDIWGPYRVDSLGGNRYFVTFSDKFSRWANIFLLEKRMDIYETFEIWKLMAERETGEKIQNFRSDNAGEYEKLAEIWSPKGVEFEFTTPYTPEQNGLSERLNRTITEAVRCMLFDAQLPTEFWGEAAKTAAYLQNCLPLGDKWGAKTPYELYKGFKPSVKHIRPFGCVVHTHIPKERRAKLKSTSYRGVFIGYCKSNEQFRVWNPSRKEVEIRTHVAFLETEKGGQLLENPD